MPPQKPDRLQRPRHEMPAFVREALLKAGLLDAYRSRPPYQQNDYIGWITRAKRPATQQKRLDQMPRELKKGDVHMKAPWRPKGGRS